VRRLSVHDTVGSPPTRSDHSPASREQTFNVCNGGAPSERPEPTVKLVYRIRAHRQGAVCHTTAE